LDRQGATTPSWEGPRFRAFLYMASWQSWRLGDLSPSSGVFNSLLRLEGDADDGQCIFHGGSGGLASGDHRAADALKGRGFCDS
jgi:hypothetical protein